MVQIYVVNQKPRQVEQSVEYGTSLSSGWSQFPSASELTDFTKVDHRPMLAVNGRELTLGELGCARAHAMIHKEIVDNGVPWGLICEEDVEFDLRSLSEIRQTLMSIPVKLSNKPLVIQLGWNANFSASWIQRKTWSQYLVKASVLAPPTGTFSYLINLEGARLSASGASQVRFVADWPIPLVEQGIFFRTRRRFVSHGKNVSIVDTVGKPRELADSGRVGRLKRFRFWSSMGSLKALVVLALTRKLIFYLRARLNRKKTST